MKTKLGMRALSLLLVLALVGAIFVPAVSAGSITSEELKMIESLEDITLREELPPKEEIYELETFESSAMKIINEMKSKKCSNEEITKELAQQGYGWYPETGACWAGTSPSKDELKIIQTIRGSEYSPFSYNSNTKGLTQANQMMYVQDDDLYRGIETYMKPSDMILEQDGTRQHVVTTHVGKKPNPSTDCWTEVGVSKFLSDSSKKFFTYDNDEGGWQFHGNADSSTYRNYEIYVTDTYENGGYLYHIWIDGNWKRSGHLAFRENDINYANEIWSNENDPSWTDDSGISIFQDGVLYQDSYALWWDPSISTGWSHYPSPCPISEHHAIDGSAWKYYTWI